MKQVLVAGIGNVLFGDDGFGVEVVRRLGTTPEHVRVADFGIRALHLAYELLSSVDRLIVIDCAARGGEPGTLYVIEPDVPGEGMIGNAHGMSLPAVFAALRTLGGTLPPTLLVGCEPESLEPGIGLSPRVTRAVPGAVTLVHQLLTLQEPS